MDKVIIDGVDVSECKYLHKFDKNYCNMSQYSDYCEAYTDCYYKQLQRLQAENERLRKEKQELNIEIVSLTSKLLTLEKSSNDLSQGINKLYEALQEIRDMATLFHSVNGNKELDHFKNNILNKINEVIGAEE